MTKRVTALALVFAMMLLPTSVRNLSAQSQAATEAEAQALSDTSSTTWLAVGCLLGAVGWAYAALGHKPEPPASTLLGKSPEYVAQYRDAYKATANRRASKQALTGCLIGTGVYIVAYVAIVAVAASSSDF